LSNVKRMDIDKSIRTVLKKSPGIQAKFLVKEMREKTGLSRSTIFEHLGSLKLRGKIYCEKGRYWLEKPKNNRGFFNKIIDSRERKTELKQLQKEKAEREQTAQRHAHMRALAELGSGFEIYKKLADIEDEEKKKHRVDKKDKSRH